MFGLFKRNKKLIEVPRHSGKIGFTDLADYERVEFGKALARNKEGRVIFTRWHDGLRYDFALAKKPRARRLFVLFSGAANRDKIQPPVFQRWKWADRFPGHVLYVSDPALFENETLGLAWYIGVGERDPLPFIADTVRSVAGYLKLKSSKVVFYGSSGGGFAALRMQNFMSEATSVAINPQVTLTKYNRSLVGRYVQTCHGTPLDEFDFEAHKSRFDLLAQPKTTDRRLILVQNTLDKSHYAKHFSAYCEMLGVRADESTRKGNVKTILFSHEKGHLQAETSEVFTQIMNAI
ncbi:hypothetical protein [Marinimicrobium locisalis]|uniref:hypothetical protein n=1 Tax=Marinimicrobium locisalis TaxID=546022 RepID=UPI003221956C